MGNVVGMSGAHAPADFPVESVDQFLDCKRESGLALVEIRRGQVDCETGRKKELKVSRFLLQLMLECREHLLD